MSPSCGTALKQAEVVLLRGATLLRADTLEEIAVLGADGLWRTPDGVVADAISVPKPTATAVVKPAARAAAHRAQDAAWLEQALDVLRNLARERMDLTVDDCWAHITSPPRDPRQMSALMVAAQKEGMVQKTSAHRPSTRPTNGGRTVRVWRSLIYQKGVARQLAIETPTRRTASDA
jgi:hypothetical protein